MYRDPTIYLDTTFIWFNHGETFKIKILGRDAFKLAAFRWTAGKLTESPDEKSKNSYAIKISSMN